MLYDKNIRGYEQDKGVNMFQVYTQKRGASLTKTLVAEFKDLEEAFECAEKSIVDKPDLKYIIEETSGHFNSYGEQLVDVVAESE